MSEYRIIEGDCLDVLATLDAGSVQTCVTSPPYYGLRDYGHDGQIGLEETPEQYVAKLVRVFREVRRVLRDDATLWLNLGDSYASGGERQTGRNDEGPITNRAGGSIRGGVRTKIGATTPGCKPKDLLGIPWATAEALRDPYYTGNMKAERDRVWMAAMIDGEGTISGFLQAERKDDGRPRSGVHVCITNSSTALLDEADRIWPASRVEHMHGERLGKRDVYRWLVHGTENKTLFLREVYPYLITKRKQAVLAYNLLLLMADAKRLGHSSQRDAVRAKRALIVSLISDANQGREPDLPSWCIQPPNVTEPGYYLRSDIIWAKPNPMPESVTDRPTKAHEYLFLLSKSARYHYDQDAIREPLGEWSQKALESDWGRKDDDYADRAGRSATQAGRNALRAKGNGYGDAINPAGRNRRSVWTVATQPFSGAHFAVFPPKLIEPCILAGSRPGDTVLDPFNGAGTTGMVALRHDRDYIGIELNPEYAQMARNRIYDDGPLLNVEAA